MAAEIEEDEDVASDGFNADSAATASKDVQEVELGEETEATDSGIETRSLSCR
jgi:hypothetical protein